MAAFGLWLLVASCCAFVVPPPRGPHPLAATPIPRVGRVAPPLRCLAEPPLPPSLPRRLRLAGGRVVASPLRLVGSTLRIIGASIFSAARASDNLAARIAGDAAILEGASATPPTFGPAQELARRQMLARAAEATGRRLPKLKLRSRPTAPSEADLAVERARAQQAPITYAGSASPTPPPPAIYSARPPAAPPTTAAADVDPPLAAGSKAPQATPRAAGAKKDKGVGSGMPATVERAKKGGADPSSAQKSKWLWRGATTPLTPTVTATGKEGGDEQSA